VKVLVLTTWYPPGPFVVGAVEVGFGGLVLTSPARVPARQRAARSRLALRYVFLRLRAALALGRLLDRVGDPMGRHVRALAWGMTAALAGTMAANFFYLTMQFYYFYGFVALALPVVFARRART
jgi:hypothetical protein